jgi:hypothetical protein
MHRAVSTVLADPGAASSYSNSNEAWYLVVVGHSGGPREGVGSFRKEGRVSFLFSLFGRGGFRRKGEGFPGGRRRFSKGELFEGEMGTTKLSPVNMSEEEMFCSWDL